MSYPLLPQAVTIPYLVFQSKQQHVDRTGCDERATDTCSVQTTEFERTAGGWVKVSGNAVLCNVAITHGGE
jgi:hypothetical protein